MHPAYPSKGSTNGRPSFPSPDSALCGVDAPTNSRRGRVQSLHPYRSFTDCRTRITVPTGQRIRLSFQQVELERNFDYIT